MTAYYNEIDPYCVQWLRNLIDAKFIAPGIVDDRPIQDVRPVDLSSFTQCHFFAGLGGWSYALRLADIPDHRPLWTGSCPCQPFSSAGQRRGFADERHLWPFWHYLVSVRRPPIIFGEQVAAASDWLRLVRRDLEALDYAVGAIPIEAASAGADHLRDRYWFVANTASGTEWRPWEPSSSRESQIPFGGLCAARDVGHSHSPRPQGQFLHAQRPDQWTFGQAGMVDMGQPDRDGWSSREFTAEAAGYGDSTFGTGRSDVSDSERERERVRGTGPTETFGATSRVQGADEQWERVRADARPVRDAGEFDWVLGADGKARRVKPGVRLLADGVPCRVSKLRAFGNAIDPRPAAAFIRAAIGS